VSNALTKQTFRSAAWIGGASLVRLGLRVVAMVILARLLTPHEYGVAAAALVVMEFAFMFYWLGIAPTLIQQQEVHSEHVKTALTASIAMSIVAGGGMWFVAPLVARLMAMPELEGVVHVLALIMPAGAFAMICESLLVRALRTREIALRSLIGFVTSAFGVAIPMAYAGCGYWALIAMHATETVVGALVVGFSARKLLTWPGFCFRAFKELWPMSVGFTLNQPFVYLSSNADKILVGRLLGTETLGLYTRASFLTTTLINVFGDVARTSIFPAMALARTDNARLQRGLIKSLFLLASLTLPASAFCIIFASEIVNLLLGPRWEAAVIPFAVLSCAMYFKLGWRTCFALFQGMGKPYYLTVIQLINALVIIGGVLAAAPHGFMAICAAVLVAALIQFLVIFVGALRVSELNWRAALNIHLAPLGMAGIVLLACLSIRELLSPAPSIALVVAGCLCGAAVVSMLAAFKRGTINEGHFFLYR
jgi:O-antigen/teichoic acid export membrane protein